MIISCYPGVGKTKLAEMRVDIVDLDSSLFKKDFEHWEELYLKVATALSDQGYVVLVSAHEEVRKWLLRNSKEKFGEIFPCAELYDEWVSRLRKRWEEDKTDENHRSYWRCKLNYYSDIRSIEKDFDRHYDLKDPKASKVIQSKIFDMSYDLEFIIETILADMRVL